MSGKLNDKVKVNSFQNSFCGFCLSLRYDTVLMLKQENHCLIDQYFLDTMCSFYKKTSQLCPLHLKFNIKTHDQLSTQKFVLLLFQIQGEKYFKGSDFFIYLYLFFVP